MGKAQRLARFSLLLLVVLSGVTEGGQAADETVVDFGSNEPIRLVRLPEGAEIRIDGVLDEAHWARLPGWDEFKVIEPDTLADPRHATIIRITYDDVGIYVGAEMHQPPETRIRRLSGRDGRALSRDSINLTLDTSGEGRYGFWFGVNLGDTLMDGTVLPERNFSIDWDGPWRGRSADTDYGWSAELFVPWATVSMPATGEVRRMGLYLSRKVAYVDERWGWPALPSTEPKFMSALQTIEMERVAPRQQYNLYPFIAIGNDSVEREQRYRVGADLFWRPSTNFQITATVNPDFGIVEADDVVINLSALEVFFPERRLFFVEGQEIFVASPRADTRGRGVGNSGAPYTLVNTRRIGGRPRRPPLPPGEFCRSESNSSSLSFTAPRRLPGSSGASDTGSWAPSRTTSSSTAGRATRRFGYTNRAATMASRVSSTRTTPAVPMPHSAFSPRRYSTATATLMSPVWMATG